MLIVVAIIGILAGAVLIGLGPVQRGGRDARRVADLRQVQNGLELYFNKCGYYPGGSAASGCTGFSPVSTWGDLTNSLIQSAIGVSQVPNDPSAGRSYFYGVSGTGSGYVLGATMEDAGNAALRQDIDGPNVYGVNCDDPVYCIQL